MEVKISVVKDKSGVMRFIKSQWNFYKNDPNFVPPVIADRKKLLDREKNPFYKHSEIELFLAERDGEVVGRIMAVKNGNHLEIHKDGVGHFGLFECVNEQEVANKLIDAASAWLKSKGLKAIRGPVDPSMNDESGMLLEGFDSPPVVLMKYNPKYYLDLMEGAGLAKVKDTYAYLLDKDAFMTDKMVRMEKIIRERNQITVRHVDFKHKEQFQKDVADLKKIYNAAWEPNWGFVKMTNEEFDFLAEDLKMIADPKFTILLEIKGKPVGFALALPDINQSLIHNKNGGMIGAGWNLLTRKKKINLVRIIVLGIIPEYQKTGADVVIYYELGQRAQEANIKWAEASWILEDNIMMNKGLTQTMNGKLYKRYRFYEKKI